MYQPTDKKPEKQTSEIKFSFTISVILFIVGFITTYFYTKNTLHNSNISHCIAVGLFFFALYLFYISSRIVYVSLLIKQQNKEKNIVIPMNENDDTFIYKMLPMISGSADKHSEFINDNFTRFFYVLLLAFITGVLLTMYGIILLFIDDLSGIVVIITGSLSIISSFTFAICYYKLIAKTFFDQDNTYLQKMCVALEIIKLIESKEMKEQALLHLIKNISHKGLNQFRKNIRKKYI